MRHAHRQPSPANRSSGSRGLDRARIAPRRSLLLLLTLAGAAPAAWAAPILSTNAPPALIVPDASFSVIRVFGALTLVLALFLGGVWLFKSWQRFALPRGRSSRLQVIETRALGGKHVLYVIGYQQERLLLAASPAGVTLVSHLPAADPTELASSQAGAANSNFVQVLQQAVHGKS